MRIVGIETSEVDVGAIHTIDVWFSERRGKWIIERLDANGDRMGAAHVCESRDEAEDCLADWLRAHGETHLVAPFEAMHRVQVARAA